MEKIVFNIDLYTLFFDNKYNSEGSENEWEQINIDFLINCLVEAKQNGSDFIKIEVDCQEGIESIQFTGFKKEIESDKDFEIRKNLQETINTQNRIEKETKERELLALLKAKYENI